MTWCMTPGLVLALLSSSGCIMTEEVLARADGSYASWPKGNSQQSQAAAQPAQPATQPPQPATQPPQPTAQPLYYALVPFAFAADMLVIPYEAICCLCQSHK